MRVGERGRGEKKGETKYERRGEERKNIRGEKI